MFRLLFVYLCLRIKKIKQQRVFTTTDSHINVVKDSNTEDSTCVNVQDSRRQIAVNTL